MRHSSSRRRIVLLAGDPYNTIIGGQGVTTTSASALETLLGLNIGDVSYFNLDGNDIEAKIEVSYILPANTFDANLNITSFLDIAGKCTVVGNNSFRNTTNLVTVNFPAATVLGQASFQATGIVGELSFPAVNDLNRINVFYLSQFITKIHFTNYTGEVGALYFRQMTRLVDVTGLAPTKLGDYCFYLCALFVGGSLDFSNIITIGLGAFRNTDIVTVNAPELVNLVGSSNFRDAREMLTFYAPKMLYAGSSTGSNVCFLNINPACIVTVNVFMQTSNGGAVEGDIQYCIDRGCTVNFVP